MSRRSEAMITQPAVAGGSDFFLGNLAYHPWATLAVVAGGGYVVYRLLRGSGKR